MSDNSQITPLSWKQFQAVGGLWLVNRALHVFGLCLVVTQEKEDGEILDAFPARVTFRGFAEDEDAEGFKRITAYMANESATLQGETED